MRFSIPPTSKTTPKHPTLCTFSHHVVYFLKLNFDPVQRLSRNILPLHALSLKHLRKFNMRLLAKTNYLQISRHDISWKYLLMIFPLINEVYRRCHEGGKMTFPGITFRYETLNSKQDMKWKFGRNKFSKKTVCNLRTRTLFTRNHVATLVNESLTNFIYQRVSPSQFQLRVMLVNL